MEAFLGAVYRLQVNQYLAASATTLLVYDYFQTLDLEGAFIWNAKWDLGKIIYLVARYPTFVEASVFIYYMSVKEISLETCRGLVIFSHAGTILAIAASEVILILRTCALSGNNPWIITFLLLLFTGVTSTASTVIGIMVSALKFDSSPVPFLRSCLPMSTVSLGFVGFALVLGLEIVIMIITLIIWFRRFKDAHSRLVESLYSDGIISFIYIVIVSLVNIVVELSGLTEVIESLILFQIVMHSLLSCRILLHVRRNASPGYFEQEYELDEVSDLHFYRPATQVTTAPNPA